MKPAILEHVNVTVRDPKDTADMLCNLFDWHIRWQGASIHGGYTIHVGTDFSYIAIYSKGDDKMPATTTYERVGGLNHIALVVEDLDAVENRVLEKGYKTENHGNYSPGRRFYFHDHDGIEYEIVSYGEPS